MGCAAGLNRKRFTPSKAQVQKEAEPTPKILPPQPITKALIPGGFFLFSADGLILSGKWVHTRQKPG